jgi:two-component system response regulator HydG
MRRGAFDFVQKPFDLEQLEVRVARALEHGRLLREVTHLRAERAARFAPENLVGTSPALQSALELVRKVAGSRSTALVTGETGTGRNWSRADPRLLGARRRTFIKVNCAALPETLLESELFGHERGAFTGADRTRVGRFEQAHGGTLFLDEIGDMSSSTQAKLLRVLQDREFTRLGGSRPLRVDVRIVAATNRELEREMREGRFREDLFYRLNVIRIAMPALRERPDDVETLAAHFAQHFAREMGRAERRLSPAAVARLRAHAWPGNVRELRNVIERAVLLADGERIEVSDVDVSMRPRLRKAPRRPVARTRCATRSARSCRAGTRRFVQKDAAQPGEPPQAQLHRAAHGDRDPSWRRNRTPSADEDDPRRRLKTGVHR